MWLKTYTLLAVAWRDFSRNNCAYVAAGMAYWALFSLFPLALAGLSLLGFLYPRPEEQGRIVEAVVKLIPVSEDYLASTVAEVVRARGPLSLLAMGGLLWSGMAVFSAVRKGINHAWHIGQTHHFVHERFIDLVMLLGMALLALIVAVFTTNVLGLFSVTRTPSWLSGGLGGKVLLEIVGLAVTFGVFLLLYRYVPNTRVAWGDTWLGALMGAVLFQGIRVGFAWFVANFGSFNLVYGALGAVMAVLAWAYLSSIALMWGAQVAFAYRLVFGTRAGTGELTELLPQLGRAQRGGGFLLLPFVLAGKLRRGKRR